MPKRTADVVVIDDDCTRRLSDASRRDILDIIQLVLKTTSRGELINA